MFEVHFWLNVCLKKQNCRFWSEDQPEALQELPMHPEKVTVWCSLSAGGITRTYFLKGDANRNATVNSERGKREMISNFFLPKMQELDLHDMWFNKTVPQAAQHA
uniref:Uncharacterized protein n=1 Tax=Ceratitis capitata TaxID=7213 RepID=W8AUP5_CERCA